MLLCQIFSLTVALAGSLPAAHANVIPDTSLAAAAATDDTVRRKRPVAVEYSDWYSRRLTIHRWSSYTMLPLFAGNYITGNQLLLYGDQAPRWAIDAHGPLATGVTALFAVNTVTGLWNLWDGRQDPSGRTWRTAHALLMLGADAGFTTAGMLSRSAERSNHLRQLHRTVAIASMSTATLSYVMMLKPFRRD